MRCAELIPSQTKKSHRNKKNHKKNHQEIQLNSQRNPNKFTEEKNHREIQNKWMHGAGASKWAAQSSSRVHSRPQKTIVDKTFFHTVAQCQWKARPDYFSQLFIAAKAKWALAPAVQPHSEKAKHCIYPIDEKLWPKTESIQINSRRKLPITKGLSYLLLYYL